MTIMQYLKVVNDIIFQKHFYNFNFFGGIKQTEESGFDGVKMLKIIFWN